MLMGAGLYAWYKGDDPPKIVTQYVTRYIDREVPVPTKNPSAPDVKYVYKTITDTVKLVEVQYKIPPEFLKGEDNVNLINPSEFVTRDRGSLFVRSFDPIDRRYYVREYKYNRPDLMLTVDGDIAIIDQYSPYVGGRLTLSYKGFGVMGGLYQNPFDGETRGLYGITYKKQIIFR
jgi:hypothetical protein